MWKMNMNEILIQWKCAEALKCETLMLASLTCKEDMDGG